MIKLYGVGSLSETFVLCALVALTFWIYAPKIAPGAREQVVDQVTQGVDALDGSGVVQTVKSGLSDILTW